MKKINFTGERAYSSNIKQSIIEEHVKRYKFAKDFVKDKVVLDLACGTGFGSKILSKEAKQVIGGDISREAIDFAKENHQEDNIEFKILDANNTKLPSDSFDVIISFETIEHVEDYKEYIKECKRVLKEDGIFICSTPNKTISSPVTRKPLNPFHVFELKQKDFIEMMDTYFSQEDIYGQILISIGKLYFIKSIIFAYTPYYKLLPIVKKILRYKPPKNKSVDKDYAKVLHSSLFKDKEPTYVIYIGRKQNL